MRGGAPRSTFSRVVAFPQFDPQRPLPMKPIFLEHYPSFSPFDRLALAELVRTAKHPGCVMAEIGCWLGQGSTQIFIAELRGTGRVLCVDTFRGSPNSEKHRELVENFDVKATFHHNVAAAGGTEVVEVLAGDAEEVAARVPDGSLDLVFVDSDHSYSTTRRHIGAWRPKLRTGGILCGHDCEGRPGEFDAGLLEKNREADTIEGNERFRHTHPGCILAVSEAFGDAVNLYAHRMLRLSDGSQGRSTIWYLTV